MPLYGEVVWVKLGTYRWWPAQVLHPSEVPPNIEKLPHDIGEFPIQFCGSHEYFWMNRGRCFLYDEGDITKFPAIKATSGKDAAYKRGLIEAAELFQKYTQVRKKSMFGTRTILIFIWNFYLCSMFMFSYMSIRTILFQFPPNALTQITFRHYISSNTEIRLQLCLLHVLVIVLTIQAENVKVHRTINNFCTSIT